MSVRILLAEDDALVRDAFTMLLGLQPELHIVGSVATCAEAVTETARLRPDVLLVDRVLSPTPAFADGIEVIRHVTRTHPDVKAIVLTAQGDAAQLRRALDAGAAGFLQKSVTVEQLRDAIVSVMRGEPALDHDLSVLALVHERSPLTPREAHVLTATLRFASVAEMASSMALSPGTVRNYLSRAIAKTGTSNRHLAAKLARDRGWI
ncbi:two-component system response regulator DesR [Amycolatopsis lexingtonensis]|uniref:Two-component system response regulator DesR n=1 Tax=Amycolatopsis lexingtonensis TaxID=218822 RepID=A0ABR9HQC5_9PSEU|nr:response regulator transcription factor [Amycolatopsis lexingtonensis]MBE1493138.1 two-component system response regulator DesR [Amycolatopsis lexingtonensis]